MTVAHLWSTEHQIELVARVVKGNAGALAFVSGLVRERDGWDLLQRLDEEKPDTKGEALYLQSRSAGTYLAMKHVLAPHAANLTFCAIARKLLT